MSKKKPKRLRTPNVPLAASGPAVAARGGGAERAAPAARAEPGGVQFDYTYVKKDLRRIAMLAAGCVALLVALSFMIR
jgi:hypothetical protein